MNVCPRLSVQFQLNCYGDNVTKVKKKIQKMYATKKSGVRGWVSWRTAMRKLLDFIISGFFLNNKILLWSKCV